MADIDHVTWANIYLLKQRCTVLWQIRKTSVSKFSLPQLNADYSKHKEDEKGEEKDVT